MWKMFSWPSEGVSKQGSLPCCFFCWGELFVPSDGSGVVEQVGGRGLSLEVPDTSLPLLSGMSGWRSPRCWPGSRAEPSHSPCSSALLRTALTRISAFTHWHSSNCLLETVVRVLWPIMFWKRCVLYSSPVKSPTLKKSV